MQLQTQIFSTLYTSAMTSVMKM